MDFQALLARYYMAREEMKAAKKFVVEWTGVGRVDEGASLKFRAQDISIKPILVPYSSMLPVQRQDEDLDTAQTA
jgi:hypothetical protein